MAFVSIKIMNEVRRTPGIKPDVRRDIGRQHEPLQGLAAIRARDFNLHPLGLAQLPQGAIADLRRSRRKSALEGQLGDPMSVVELRSVIG